MRFRNYLEEAMLEVLDSVAAKQKDLCSCAKCRTDIMALALNQVLPKYVVTDLGRIHTKLEAVRLQFRVNVVRALVQAIEKVRKNPRHTSNVKGSA